MPFENIDKYSKMKWILFLVFVIFFIIITSLTILAIFTDFGSLTSGERDILFKSFIVEIGISIVALFYVLFGLKKGSLQGQSSPKNLHKVRLRFGNLTDIKMFKGSQAICLPYLADGTEMEEIKCHILDDEGPVLRLDLPNDTLYVFVSIKTNSNIYSGSFAVDSYFVDMKEEA